MNLLLVQYEINLHLSVLKSSQAHAILILFKTHSYSELIPYWTRKVSILKFLDNVP